jgi:hypothetical protein
MECGVGIQTKGTEILAKNIITTFQNLGKYMNTQV